MMETRDVTKHFSLKFSGVQQSFSKALSKLLPLGFGILLISWLVSQVDFSAARVMLQNLSALHLAMGLLWYGLGFYLRAKRFQALLPHETSLCEMFPIVLVHYTALNIVPARLGELSYVYLLKKLQRIPAGCSVSSLLLARVFDQMAISTLFLLSLGLVDLKTPWLKTVSWIVGAVLLLSVLALLLLLAYKELCVTLFKKLLHTLQWEEHSAVRRLLGLLEEILVGSDEIKSKKMTLMVFAQSLAIWLSILSVSYSVWKAFHIHLSYFEVVLSSTFLILLTVIPFQVFSGLGIRSMTWVTVAGALGVNKDAAIVSALGSRVVMAFYLFFLGAYGLLRLSQKGLWEKREL